MTKFEELCNSFTTARENFKKYENDCQELAVDIWNKILDYFEIPPNQLTSYEFDDYGNYASTNPPLLRSMNLRDNSCFDFGLGITLYEAPNISPYQTVVLLIQVSIDSDGNHKAQLGKDGKKFDINRQKDESFYEFFDHIFQSVTDSFERGLTNLRDQNTFREIGFTAKNPD